MQAEPSTPTPISYSKRVIACLRHLLARSRSYNNYTTADDITWVEALLTKSREAFEVPFHPCVVVDDYKRENVVAIREADGWRISGVFDLMGTHFGDGEADLSRTVGMYIGRDDEPELAREFVRTYLDRRPSRPGFAERFVVYTLFDRVVLWEYMQRTDAPWWDKQGTFRDWAERYTSFQPL